MKRLFPAGFLIPSVIFGVIGFRECMSGGWGNAPIIAWAAGFGAFVMIFLVQLMVGEIANLTWKLIIASSLGFVGLMILIFGYLL